MLAVKIRNHAFESASQYLEGLSENVLVADGDFIRSISCYERRKQFKVSRVLKLAESLSHILFLQSSVGKESNWAPR